MPKMCVLFCLVIFIFEVYKECAMYVYVSIFFFLELITKMQIKKLENLERIH
jgi:hypothetical protein